MLAIQSDVTCVSVHVVRFAGIYTHGGHSYGGSNAAEIQRISAIERDAVVGFAEKLRQAGVKGRRSCFVCCVLCAVCCVLCAVCCVLCAVCCVRCAVCGVLCAVLYAVSRCCALIGALRAWLVAKLGLQARNSSVAVDSGFGLACG